MDFDSHTSDVVGHVVRLINEVTPGERHGRMYFGPSDVTAAVREVMPTSRTPGQPTDEDAAELAEWAVKLREVVGLVDGDDVDSACLTLNSIMRTTGAVPTLSRHDGEPWHLHFHGAAATWAVSWAASMATALAVVLGNPTVERLGICYAPACDRVYVDVSRNGTRRFCSTSCQNRVKAAAFRARKTTTS